MASTSSRFIAYLIGPSVALLLTACGGSGGGDTGTGTLSASITDSAVEEVDAVNLSVSGLRLRRQGGGGQGLVDIDLRDESGNALELNLLDYQHGETFPLFNDVRVPAGIYSHAVLLLEAPARTPNACASQDPLAGSHVVEKAGGAVPIFVPSGFNGGIQLASPFRVPQDGDAEIVIDFDLLQALLRPTGQACYFLRPAFRVEAVRNTGRIAGTVAPSMLDGSNGLCSDADPATGNAIYVYRGADQMPGDIDAVDPADDGGDADPMATAKVELDERSGEYQYVVGFLPSGEYTVAFTCQADQDLKPNPIGVDEGELLANDMILFQDPQNANVEAPQTTTLPFPSSP